MSMEFTSCKKKGGGHEGVKGHENEVENRSRGTGDSELMS